MQNVLKIGVVAAAMLAAGYGVSFAQQVPQPGPGVEHIGDMDGHGGQHRGGKHRQGKGGMRMIDVNMDGVVSDEEASMLADRTFSRMDQDRNDALSEAEFATLRHGRRGWFGWGQEEAAAVTEVRKAKFVAMDADKNASVSRAEFFVDAKAKLAAADDDKDGKVTPWEFRAMTKG